MARENGEKEKLGRNRDGEIQRWKERMTERETQIVRYTHTQSKRERE